DVTFDESAPFYHLFPYRIAPLPPPPLFLAPDFVERFKVAVDSGAAWDGATRGAESGGAEPAGAGPGGIEPVCTEPGVAECEGAEPGGAELERAELGGAELGGAEPECAEPGGAEPERTEPGGTFSSRGPPGALSWREPLSPPQLREWFARRTRLQSGAAGARGSAARGTGAVGAGGAAGVGAGGTGAGAAGGTGAAGPGGARTGGTGAGAAGGTGAVAAGGTGAAGPGGAAGVGAGDPRAGDIGAGGAGPRGAGAVGAGSGDTGQPRPYFVPLLQQVLGLPSSTGLTPPLLCPPPDQSQPPLQPASPLPAPSPYTEQTRGLIKRSEPRTPLLSPPASSLADGPDPESDLFCAASPTVPGLLAIVVTDPSFESATASALVAELVKFAAAGRLDYAVCLVAEYPP
ncbi:unnamed protein product, partial [Closterium sp. NIES-54]